MFLGVVGEVRDEVYELEKKTKNVSFNLVFTENPLLNFVELPQDMKALEYQNIICGTIRGAFHTVRLDRCSSTSKAGSTWLRTF